MKKFLRYYLVVLMALFGFSAYAQTDELTWDKLLEKGKANNYQEFSGKTITSSAVYAGQASSGTDSYIQLRTANSNSGIVTTASGGKLKSITIDFNSKTTDRSVDIYGDNTAYSAATELYNSPKGTKLGSISAADENKTLTVSGDYTFLGLRSNNGAIYIDKITIVWEGGGSTITVTAPTISGTTPFTESTQVTITGTPDGGKTYYTTDGSDPTSSSTLYSAPFTINETTTVKAISYDKDGNASSVSSKTFTKETYTEAANIAAFNVLEAGTKNIKLTLTNAQVLGAGNNNYAIKDASGSTLIYQSGLSYTKGQILNGTIVCERADYNGFTEIKSITDNTLTATEGTVTSKTATPEEVIAAGYFADSYKMEKVECKADNGRYYITVGENKIQVYDNFKYNYAIPADGTYNLTGVLGAFKDVPYQFWLTEAPEAAGEVTVPEASDIDDFKSQDQGKLINLNLANAQVVYAWTSSNGNIQAFVRDDTGAICMDFRNNNEPGKSFTTDKIVNGSIIMNNTVYNGLPQASATAETNTEKLTFSDGSAAEPVKISSADVSRKINDLVLLENVTITEKDGKYYVDDVQLYNQFKLEAFNDFSTFVGEGKNVKGIAVIYQPKTGDPIYEIYTIDITSAGGGETPVETSKAIYYWIDTFVAANEVTFDDGAKIAITGNTDKTISKGNKITVDGSEYTSMKLSNGAQNTLTMPAGCKVVKMTFYSYINKPSTEEPRSNYWKEVAGVQYDETNALSCYNDGDLTKPDVREFILTEPSNSVTFTNTGYQLCYVLVVEYTKSGSDGIQNVIKPVVENGIRYNLAGQRVDENYKGVVIMNGKKYVVK